jgi:Tol biopolymer transport system component
VFDNAPRITGLSISPDDKQLAFVWYRPYEKSAPSSIYIISLTDGSLKELYKAEDWNDGTKFEGVEWSPDARYVYVVMPSSPGEQGSVASLVRISTENGELQRTGLTQKMINKPRLSSDGNKMVFYRPLALPNSELWKLSKLQKYLHKYFYRNYK